MKIRALATAMAIGISFTTPVNAQCASSVPTTGLGLCIDFMLTSSERLTDQVGDVSAASFVFSWGAASETRYHTQPPEIVIQSYDCMSGDTAGLYSRTAITAHELGHAVRGPIQDTSSREAFIQSWCDNEGYAVINNILGRQEIQACSMNMIDIPVVAANETQLLAVYAAGGDVMRNVGDAFCDNNITSSTGEPYRDFYGDHYDQHYGSQL